MSKNNNKQAFIFLIMQELWNSFNIILSIFLYLPNLSMAKGTVVSVQSNIATIPTTNQVI